MKQTFYSISELETLNPFKRRAIHFYVQEKVIPPPIGSRGAAKYTEKHLLSLKLIAHLKKSHIKLSGIRETLDAMTVEEMQSVLKKAEEIDLEAWNGESLGKWVGTQIAESKALYRTKSSQSQDNGLSAEKVEQKDDTSETPLDKNNRYLRELKRNPAVNETSWERFEIVKGLELNVRKDIMEKLGSRLIQWIEYLKKAF